MALHPSSRRPAPAFPVPRARRFKAIWPRTTRRRSADSLEDGRSGGAGAHDEPERVVGGPYQSAERVSWPQPRRLPRARRPGRPVDEGPGAMGVTGPERLGGGPGDGLDRLVAGGDEDVDRGAR